MLYQAVEGSTADQLRDLMDCLKNLYLRFWFRYVLPYRNRLEHSTNVVGFYREVVARSLDEFVSKPTFEEICRAWVLDEVEAGTLPAVERVGAWWGPVPAPSADQPSDRPKLSSRLWPSPKTVLLLQAKRSGLPNQSASRFSIMCATCSAPYPVPPPKLSSSCLPASSTRA